MPHLTWKHGLHRPLSLPILTFMGIFLLWGVDAIRANPSSSATLSFETLQDRLIRDGFPTEAIHALFQRPDVRFATRQVASYFVHRESSLNYDQYLAPDLIVSARDYQKIRASELAAVEQKYGVDRHVIVAILLVETRLGSFQAKSPVMNTLATMASLSDTSLRDRFWEEIQGTTNLSRDQYEERVSRRSEWAYQELKAFIRYTAREGIDPGGIKGSYAGAMGIPQFMPSNALTLAVDGDSDGRIDLFNHADAIASVGNYLKHHGWKPGLGREDAYKVILRYNYSRFYANTILDIRDLLVKG